MPKFAPLDVRFEAKIKRSENDCWEWTAHKTKRGYGIIKLGRPSRKDIAAHRVSYELFRGNIPEGMFVLHHCDNPGCVRPDHLFLGTKADNSMNMALKGRAGRTVLGREDAYAVLWREASGETRRSLAREYGVTYQAIRAGVLRRNWSSLSVSHD